MQTGGVISCASLSDLGESGSLCWQGIAAKSTLIFNELKKRLHVTLWLCSRRQSAGITCCNLAFTPFPPIHTWCISSLIKAVCCDAFNINHIQCVGRTQSSVHQLESAHASGAGYVPLRSIISLKSYRLIVWAVSVSGFAGRAISSPFAQSLKLGLETFSTTFPWTALAMILADRRSLEMRADSLWILIGNNV